MTPPKPGDLIQTTDRKLWLVESADAVSTYARPVRNEMIAGREERIVGTYEIVRRAPQVRLRTRPWMRGKHEKRERMEG